MSLKVLRAFEDLGIYFLNFKDLEDCRRKFLVPPIAYTLYCIQKSSSPFSCFYHTLEYPMACRRPWPFYCLFKAYVPILHRRPFRSSVFCRISKCLLQTIYAYRTLLEPNIISRKPQNGRIIKRRPRGLCGKPGVF